MNYDRTHKVPMWIVLDIADKKKREKVLKWFTDRDALVQEWPSLYYKQEVMKYKKMGYKTIKENESYIMPNSLILRSAVDTIRSTVSKRSNIVLNEQARQFRATVNSDEDYENVMNMILNTVDSLYLSQSFQIFERCCDRFAKKRSTLFITPEGGRKQILTKISDQVIVISENNEGDVNISDISLKDLNNTLESEIVKRLDNSVNQNKNRRR